MAPKAVCVLDARLSSCWICTSDPHVGLSFCDGFGRIVHSWAWGRTSFLVNAVFCDAGKPWWVPMFSFLRHVPRFLSCAFGVADVGSTAIILPACALSLPGIWAVVVIVPSTLAMSLRLPVSAVIVELIPVRPLSLFCLLTVFMARAASGLTRRVVPIFLVFPLLPTFPSLLGPALRSTVRPVS